MKKTLFATTALAGLAIGSVASAQGIALFGDARLGLGYNINNNGSANGLEDLRAVSRVRFGVNMTGETDSGITFGATIRADNAIGGQGAAIGQTAGSVFVSGSWGTLTMGDTNGADEQWVGDVPGDYSLTGLGDADETLFISNGGGFGDDDTQDFANDPNARPTIRYDFDIAGFGLSLSSNKSLNAVGVGGGYSADFGGGSWTVGVGYYDFQEFDIVTGSGTATLCATEDPLTGDVSFADGECAPGLADSETVGVPFVTGTDSAPAGHQWSAGLKGTYDAFGFGLTYVNIEGDGDTKVDQLLVGASFGFDAWSVGAYYGNILNAEGSDTINEFDGDQTYSITAQYDLGGGASVNTGFRRTYDESDVADFGIKMAF
jgi:outer membrane protein OmpU